MSGWHNRNLQMCNTYLLEIDFQNVSFIYGVVTHEITNDNLLRNIFATIVLGSKNMLMQKLKIASIIMLILLALLIITTFLLGGFMPLFSIAFGFLFVYYLLLYVVARLFANKINSVTKYLLYLFFFVPIIWVIIDMEGMINFLLQWIHLDMK